MQKQNTLALPITKELSVFLNFLRAISAFVVLLSHITDSFVIRWYGSNTLFFHSTFVFAEYAVMIFFILSGFLITYSILNNIQQHQTFHPFDYLKSRFLRLYPPLLLSLMIMIIIVLLIKAFNLYGAHSYYVPTDHHIEVIPGVLFNIKSFFASLFLIQGLFGTTVPEVNGPLWSLSYEFWYYILAMLLTLALYNKKIIFSGIMLLIIIFASTHDHMWKFLMLFSVWASGSGLALLYASKKIFEKSTQIILFISFIFFIFLASLLTLFASLWYSHFSFFISGLYPYISSDLTFALISVGLSCIIGLIISARLYPKSTNKIYSFISHQSFSSYTLYVIQFPLILFALSLIGKSLDQLHFQYHVPRSLLLLIVLPLIFITITYLSSLAAKIVENKKMIDRGYNYFKAIFKGF